MDGSSPAGNAPSASVDASLVRKIDATHGHVDFLVPEMHCAGCIARIEGTLARLPGVDTARANLTTRRVGITFKLGESQPDAMLDAIERLGYAARPFDAAALDKAVRDPAGADLLRSLAVAGFAAGNVMLLSVSVWSGADAATRDLFHWLSALIALPAAAYAGRPFFRSAFKALAGGGLNMDVPIAIGVSLTLAMSLYETAIGGAHAYFDAAITLLFFLLVGRYLDYRMRDVARSAATRLMSLAAVSAMRMRPDGTTAHVAVADVIPGDLLQVTAGERFPLDGIVTAGASDVDRAMLTGEPTPEHIGIGSKVFAGTMNLTGPVTFAVSARANDTLLADIVRLTEAAERSSSRYVRLADRASRMYAPAVHGLALAAAIGWLVAGAGLHQALTIAVAVLIITCPCALGLAVPAVQVVAGGFLLGRGVMLKSGSALERLALVDVAVFDKTGTLTVGKPRLVAQPDLPQHDRAVAVALGALSHHPLARALAGSLGSDGPPVTLTGVHEIPGDGMVALLGTREVRLGRREFVSPGTGNDAGGGSEIWFRIGDTPACRFGFADALRRDAASVVATLHSLGIRSVLLSGDRPAAVSAAAAEVGISDWHASQQPTDKARHLEALKNGGHHVLMVGDGINDAPALASAFVSMSPSSAADISQTASDMVFTGDKLAAVETAVIIARKARTLALQNFALAVGYNVVAVPLAILGQVTPLVAAIAMSSSSIVVTVNALRLRWSGPRRPSAART